MPTPFDLSMLRRESFASFVSPEPEGNDGVLLEPVESESNLWPFLCLLAVQSFALCEFQPHREHGAFHGEGELLGADNEFKYAGRHAERNGDGAARGESVGGRRSLLQGHHCDNDPEQT